METFKRIKNFIKYHIGPKEVIYDSPYNEFMPKNIMDIDNFHIYVIEYDAKNKLLRCIASFNDKGQYV